MNISTDFAEDRPFHNKPSGGYEWWYFDAVSNDKEWGIVAIFYQGNPFSPEYIKGLEKGSTSPDEHPALSISVYHKGRTEFYSFIEYTHSDFYWNDGQEELKIGNCSFVKKQAGQNLSYIVELTAELPSKHSLTGTLKFESEVLPAGFFTSSHNKSGNHFWNLVQPRATVKGALEISGRKGNHSVEFNGMGYHDHNVGLEPLKEDFEDWYWGRFHFAEYTLIYYMINRREGNEHRAWLLDNYKAAVVDEFTTLNIENHSKTYFGLNSARKIKLESTQTKVIIETDNIVDNGPFYQRFLGKATLNYNGNSYISEGVSEYIYPKKIYSRFFWWAVKMRLRFISRKPHWVQKIKMFYEWTW